MKIAIGTTHTKHDAASSQLNHKNQSLTQSPTTEVDPGWTKKQASLDGRAELLWGGL